MAVFPDFNKQCTQVHMPGCWEDKAGQTIFHIVESPFKEHNAQASEIISGSPGKAPFPYLSSLPWKKLEAGGLSSEANMQKWERYLCQKIESNRKLQGNRGHISMYHILQFKNTQQTRYNVPRYNAISDTMLFYLGSQTTFKNICGAWQT